MKRVLIAILLWVASAVSFASPEVDRVEAALRSGDGATVVSALSKVDPPDPEFGKYIQSVISHYPNNQREIQELKGLIRLSRIASGEPAPVVYDVGEVAKQERKKSEYYDPGQKSQSNWVGKGTEGVRKWVDSLREDLSGRKMPDMGGPAPNFSVPDAFVAFVRILVMVAVAACSFVGIFFFGVPFPAIIGGAILLGLIGSGVWRAGPEEQRRDVVVSLGDSSLVISDTKSGQALSGVIKHAYGNRRFK